MKLNIIKETYDYKEMKSTLSEAGIPPGAKSVKSPADVPDGWSVVQGPKGGKWAVPPQGGSQGGEDPMSKPLNPDQGLTDDEAKKMRDPEYEEPYGTGFRPLPEEKPKQSGEEKPGQELDYSAKKLLDLLQTVSNDYTDIDKVEVSGTPKGNWLVTYDGKKVGTVGGDQISEDTIIKYNLEDKTV